MIDKILVRNRVYSFWVIKKYQFFIFFFLWIFCLILYSTTQTTMYYTPNLDGNTCRNNYSREHVCTSLWCSHKYVFFYFFIPYSAVQSVSVIILLDPPGLRFTVFILTVMTHLPFLSSLLYLSFLALLILKIKSRVCEC